jgi:hypothetical protein
MCTLPWTATCRAGLSPDFAAGAQLSRTGSSPNQVPPGSVAAKRAGEYTLTDVLHEHEVGILAVYLAVKYPSLIR